jgi:hypothetical protein
MEPEGSLLHSQVPTTCLYSEPAQSSPSLHTGHTKASVQVRGFVCEYFVTKIRFHGEDMLAPRPIPKLEDHPLSAVHNCLFNIFAATLHIGGRSSFHNVRTRHAVMTETHLSHGLNQHLPSVMISAEYSVTACLQGSLILGGDQTKELYP